MYIIQQKLYIISINPEPHNTNSSCSCCNNNCHYVLHKFGKLCVYFFPFFFFYFSISFLSRVLLHVAAATAAAAVAATVVHFLGTCFQSLHIEHLILTIDITNTNHYKTCASLGPQQLSMFSAQQLHQQIEVGTVARLDR